MDFPLRVLIGRVNAMKIPPVEKFILIELGFGADEHGDCYIDIEMLAKYTGEPLVRVATFMGYLKSRQLVTYNAASVRPFYRLAAQLWQ